MANNEDSLENANGLTDSTTSGHGEEVRPQLRRGALRALVQDFSPLNFTWCMNSGALGQLLHQQPYRFNGIDVLADIFFMVDLVLFVVFSVLFIARLVCFKAAYQEIIFDMGSLTFVPTWVISFMTLTSGVSLIVSTAWWGGYAFSLLAYSMWWILVVWNLATLLWAFTNLIRHHEASDRRMPISIIIPAVSVSTVAITGAVVVTYSYNLSAQLAIPVIILSFNFVGIGILLGTILYVYLLHALLAEGLPPPDQTASLFILVGPMGQSAAALQILGACASTYGRFGDYNSGTFLTAEAPDRLNAACILVALLLNGLGVIWLILSVWAMAERAIQGTLRWTPAWNAIIFPNATLTTSFLVFSVEMDSIAYRVVTAMFTIILVIVYFINLGFTIWKISKGELLIVREDLRVKQRTEQEKRE